MGEQAEKETISNNNCSLLHSTLTEAIIELLDEETLEILEKKLMHTINIRYGDAIERHLRSDENFRHLFEDFPPAPLNDSKKSSRDTKYITVPLTKPPQCAPSDKGRQPVKKIHSNAKHPLKQPKANKKINGYSNFKKLQPKVDKQKVIVQYSNNGVFVTPVILKENNYFPSICENRQTNLDKDDFFHSHQTKKKAANIKPIKVSNQENNCVSSVSDNRKMENVINNIPLRKIRTIRRKPFANRSDYEISEDSAIPASRSSVLPEVELIYKPPEFTSNGKRSPKLEHKVLNGKSEESKGSQIRENSVLLPNVTISIINKPALEASMNKKKIEPTDNQTKKITNERGVKVTQNIPGTEAKNISTENDDKASWIKDASTKNITTYLRKNSKAKKSVIEEDIINRLGRMLLNGIEVKNVKKTQSSTHTDEKEVDTLQKKHECVSVIKLENRSMLNENHSDLKIDTKSESVSVKSDGKQEKNALKIEKDFPFSISLNKIINEMDEGKHSFLNITDNLKLNYSSVIPSSKNENQKTTDIQDINENKNDANVKSDVSNDSIGNKEKQECLTDVKINESVDKENGEMIDSTDDNKKDKSSFTVGEKTKIDDVISKTEEKNETETLAEHKNDIEYVTISAYKENKIEIININTEQTEETSIDKNEGHETNSNCEKFVSVNYESSITANNAESIYADHPSKESTDGSNKDSGQTFLVKIIYKKDDSNIEDFNTGYTKQIMDEERNFDVEITKVSKEKELDEMKANKRTWEETKDKDEKKKRYNLRSSTSSEKVQKKRTRRLFGTTEIVTRSRLSL